MDVKIPQTDGRGIRITGLSGLAAHFPRLFQNVKLS
jgi:hypothetical protein